MATYSAGQKTCNKLGASALFSEANSRRDTLREDQYSRPDNSAKSGKHMTLQLSNTLNPLRIAVLAHLHHPIRSPYAGGMETHTAHLVEDLGRRGHCIILFAKGGSLTSSMELDVTVVPVLSEEYEVRGYPDEDQRHEQHRVLDMAMETAIEAIRQGKFDAVINNSLSPIPHGTLQGIPTVHILHTPPLPRIIAQLQTLRKTDEVHRYVTVSQTNAKKWSQWLPDLQVVSNGIDVDRWAPDPNTVVIAETASWAGRITPEKGTHLAIAAARNSGLNISIAGPIQDHEYFDELIVPFLDNQVKYLGHLSQEKLREMIGSSQVFISSPLWEEPFGLTTLEAMACGTPVAAVPAGAMAELLGRTGGVLATAPTDIALGVAATRAKNLSRAQVMQRASVFSRDRMISPGVS